MTLERAQVPPIIGIAIAFGLASTEAAAQASTASEVLRMPALMISIGAGAAKDIGDWRDGGPVQTASALFLVRRHLAVEGEITRWKTHTNDRRTIFDPGSFCIPNELASECETRRAGMRPIGFEWVSNTDKGWSGGANLLFRSEPGRVTGFVGGGGFVGHRSHGSHGDGTAIGGQALGGADVQIIRPLRAYVDLRFSAMSGQVRLAATSGVRLVAQTRPVLTKAPRRMQPMQASVAPADAVGKTVRVSLSNGARPAGKLISLSATEVVLREGRYAVDQVLRVETVHHKAAHGAWIGCLSGLAATKPVVTVLDFPPELGIAMMCGIGTGAGALIGALMDISAADKHVVYAAPPSAVHVAPIVTATRAGLSVGLGW